MRYHRTVYFACVHACTLRSLSLAGTNVRDFHNSLIWQVLILVEFIISSSDTYQIFLDFLLL